MALSLPRDKDGAAPHDKPALSSVQLFFVVGLLFTQVAGVYASIYLKTALAGATPPHPVVFALYRELGAGLLLLIGSSWYYRLAPRRADWLPLACLGLCLFLNQLLYILGLQFAGVTIATCLQPSIPVFTVGIAMLLGQERVSLFRVSGAILAAVGASAMVYGASAARAAHAAPADTQPLLGALCLVGNCLAMSFYYINARAVAPHYPPACLTAWAYMTAATWMAGAAAVSVPRAALRLPAPAVGPLVFWIFVTSMLGYTILTAATRHLPATQVASFVCVQPIVGTAAAVYCLGEELVWWDAAAGLIVAGLFMVLREVAAAGPALLAGAPARLSFTGGDAEPLLREASCGGGSTAWGRSYSGHGHTRGRGHKGLWVTEEADGSGTAWAPGASLATAKGSSPRGQAMGITPTAISGLAWEGGALPALGLGKRRWSDSRLSHAGSCTELSGRDADGYVVAVAGGHRHAGEQGLIG